MEVLNKQHVVNTLNIKIMQIYSVTNILLKNNWYQNSTDNEAFNDIKLQNLNKYLGRVALMVNKLSYFHDFFFVCAVLKNKVCVKYNEKMQLNKY